MDTVTYRCCAPISSVLTRKAPSALEARNLASSRSRITSNMLGISASTLQVASRLAESEARESTLVHQT